MTSNRFSLTLCLGSVRTRDAQTFAVQERGDDGELTVAVGAESLRVDEVVPKALPSRVASAVVAAIEATQPHTHSAHALVGAALFEPGVPPAPADGSSLGHAIAEDLVRSQHLTNRAHARLLFDECLIFAKHTGSSYGDDDDSGGVCCELVRATDSWPAVQRETLGRLRDISLILFKYPENRSAAVLLGPQLTTSHIAALALAPRRGVYLYVDGRATASEVGTCVGEMRAVRESLRDLFARPGPATLRYHGIPGVGDGGASRVLDALARSDEEYTVLQSAVEADLTARLAEAQRDRERLDAELAQERTARRRERTASAQPPGPPALVASRVEAAEAQQLREALQEAQRSRRFAEEKLRLLQFKHGLAEDRAPSLAPGRAVSVTRSVAPAAGHASSVLLASENLALAHEFQQREQLLQARLRETAAQLAEALATQRKMEDTLLLQSRTIVEARRAIVAREESTGSHATVRTAAPH